MKNYFPDPTGFATLYRQSQQYQETVNNFADKLHSQFCRLGHEDNCTWFFEKDWDGWAHKHWQVKAKELLSSGAPEDLIFAIIKTFKGM